MKRKDLQVYVPKDYYYVGVHDKHNISGMTVFRFSTVSARDLFVDRQGKKGNTVELLPHTSDIVKVAYSLENYKNKLWRHGIKVG